MSDLLSDRPIVSATSISAVPCAYCRQAIPAASFIYWSRAKRLLSAECPECTRRTTVLTAIWQQYNDLPRQLPHG